MSDDVSMELLHDGDEDAWREVFAILNQDVQKIADAVLPHDEVDQLAEEILEEIATPKFLKHLETFRELRMATRMATRDKLSERADDPTLSERVSALYESPRLLDTRRLGGNPRDEEKWRKVYQALRDVLEKDLQRQGTPGG